jgi:hypothetical protein
MSFQFIARIEVLEYLTYSAVNLIEYFNGDLILCRNIS